ncbi:hypothetical protein BDV93DRAFT_512760 [Ceratobasidium sp. AG-I]|nr:hypothetical protein BDV93DRAFT_512760 [Ceratobasidium sp. AG-I]
MSGVELAPVFKQVSPKQPHTRIIPLVNVPNLVWQGGKGSVPWIMIEQDGSNGQYFFVKPKRLPPGVTTIRRLCFWTTTETNAWFAHLTNGDEGKLNNDQIFQWFQTSLGIFHHNLVATAAPNSYLRYEPESILFAQRMAQERAQIPIKIRKDKLPPIPLESYIPCTPSELNVLRSFLPNSISVEILGDLIEYEMMGPPRRAMPVPKVPRAWAARRHATLCYGQQLKDGSNPICVATPKWEERTQVGNESLAAFRPADLDAGNEDLEIIETPRSENEWEANDSEPQGYKSMSEQSSERSVVSSQGQQKSVIRSTRRKRTSGGGTPKAKRARSGQNESSEDKEDMYLDDEESADASAESTRRADRKAGRNTGARAACRSNSRKIPTTPGSSESKADDADSGDEIASAPVHLYDALRFGMKLDLEAFHILHTRQTSVTYVDGPLTFEIRARFQSDGYMATGYLLEKVD